MTRTTTVFFDVDFTLIHPGPTFDGEGYQRFAARHRVEVSSAGSRRLWWPLPWSWTVPRTTSTGPTSSSAMRVGYSRRWGASVQAFCPVQKKSMTSGALCQHFALYDDVQPALERLHQAGFQIGLISNTHRCLTSFQSHFELDEFITAALSSSDHGYMKPHPSIFEAALKLVGATPEESVMVGDSLDHDIHGARQIGMRGVLLARSDAADVEVPVDVPVIRTLGELPHALEQMEVLSPG